MSRAYNGSSQYHYAGSVYLSAAAGPFTVAGWIQPGNLTANQYVLMSGATPHWAVLCGYLDNYLEFFHSANPTPNPRTDSGILVSDVTTTGCFFAYRYLGAGAEWSKWKNGTKTIINAAITFTLPTIGTATYIASAGGGAFCEANIAEIAIWNTALSDAQMAELGAGVAADVVAPGGLLAYWPLRGHSTPEINYAVPAAVMTPIAAPASATHPVIVPPKVPPGPVDPAWVVDLVHPTAGTIRAATRDLGAEEWDADILGAYYPALLVDDIRLIEELPEGGAGVMVPANTVLSLLNTRNLFTHAQEWRNVPVTIRYYDRASHALVTEFSGVVTDKNLCNNRAVFPCSNQDAAVLQQLVPRAVIEATNGTVGIVDTTDGGLQRTDVGVPVPVPHGVGGLMNPPFIAMSAGTAATALNGQDMLIGWGGENIVRKVWFDSEPTSPGLEVGSQWHFAPPEGTTPTYVSGTVFTVTGSLLDRWYDVGRSVRHMPTDSIFWRYSYITAVNMGDAGGTVTLQSPGPLTAPMGTVEISGDYAVWGNQYQYVGTGGTTALTSIRFYGSTNSAIIADVADSTRANPANAIYFLLTDPDYGLGESADLASFTTAAGLFIGAGLGDAVRGVLGGDRVQRRAIDVINEWCSFRGARIWKDADTSSWKIVVDDQPPDSGLTFSFGETISTSTSSGNVAEVVSVTTTPLEQSVSTLKLRYHGGGRDRGSKPLEQLDYAYSVIATAHGVGGEKVIVSPWLRATETAAPHLEAARVCYYQARTLATQDRSVVFKCRHQGRRLNLGDLCTLQLRTSPGADLSGQYRVMKRERTLSDFTFLVAGPYTIDVHSTEESTILSYVAVPSADINPDEREIKLANDANLIINSDFSSGLARQTVGTFYDEDVLPGWTVANGPSIASIQVVTNPQVKGGHYLQVTVIANPGSDWPVFYAYNALTWPAGAGKGPAPVMAGQNYLFSIYASIATTWRFSANWYDVTNDPFLQTIPAIRAMPGDVTGTNWRRYYCVLTAPAGAVSCGMGIELHGSTSPLTYQLAAVQFEEVTRLSVRPTPWHRNPQYGVQPALILSGAQTVRATDALENGTKLSVPSFAGQGLAGSGTVTLGTAAVGSMTGLTGRVMAGITGATAFYVAADYGGGTILRLTSNIGTVAATTFGDAQTAVTFPMGFIVATPLVAIAVGGTAFTGGTVRVSTHMTQHIEPTS